MIEEKKFEAHAYLKYKDEEKETQPITDEVKNSMKKLIGMLGRIFFEAELGRLYDEGMRSGPSSPAFMILLTDLFIVQSVSFYMISKDKEQIIREMNSFMDATKQDALTLLENIFRDKDKFKS